MTIENALTRRLQLAHPIIQAPLAGGGDTPALIAAVGEAGALGFIGAAYLAPREIVEAVRAVRALTARPFGISLFAPPSPPAPAPGADASAALARVAPYFAELGLPPPTAPGLPADAFGDAARCRARQRRGSVQLHLRRAAARARSRRSRVGAWCCSAPRPRSKKRSRSSRRASTRSSRRAAEAGGHRGTFAGDFDAGSVGTVALVPQIADAVEVPVIASGGIMDGRGIAAALALGASAVQMGTAFLTCDEAGIPEAYKAAILAAGEHETRLTRAFSGRPARGIVNRFMTEVERSREAILPFPLQNALTRPLRAAAAKQGRAEFLSLWAGQGIRLARRQSAASLVQRLAAETESVLQRLCAGA